MAIFSENLGKLFVVSTPIGNLNDITRRALETLQAVDLVACEDTRQTSKLLNHYQIKVPVISYHQHSGESKINYLIEQLLAGKSIAQVSDSGTPTISDPGQLLVQAAIRQQIPVCPIPGPAAFLAALQASGVPAARFSFYGFLPTKNGRQTMLQKVIQEDKPVVLYESCYRIRKLLSELASLTDPQVVVAKELTKLYETFFRGPASQIEIAVPKGEYVVIVLPK